MQIDIICGVGVGLFTLLVGVRYCWLTHPYDIWENYELCLDFDVI
jgi:hypothetical protein